MSDPVDRPSHYSRWKMEPIEFIMINDLVGWLANVIKYAMRYDAKDGLQDLYKARSYLDMKIRQLEGIPRYWEKPVREQRELSQNDCVPSSFPNKPCGPTQTAVFMAPPSLFSPGSITKLDYPGQLCVCGVNVTNPDWTCEDQDCLAKKAGWPGRRQKDSVVLHNCSGAGSPCMSAGRCVQ